MIYRPHILSALIAGTALWVTGCSIAPGMSPQELQIQDDLAGNKFLPATREMRDAIETQELFAQAAFWSNEYTLNPSDLESALKLSAAVRKLGNPGRAVEITQHTRALYPRDPYLLAEHGAALVASERSLDAIPILDQALATTPGYGRLWSLKGAALDQQERYAEARKHYDRALRITPNDPNVMANVGLSYALSGDLITAEGWLRRAASMPNASESVKQNLILILQLQGKTDESQKLAAQTRPPAKFPQVRPAHNTASAGQRNVAPFAPPQAPVARAQNQQLPQARLQTGPASGQQFKSASEAARAVAANRAGQQAPAAYAQPLQANVQTTSPVAAAQTYSQGYPQAYSAPGYSAQNPALSGAQSGYQQQPERRAPLRRRR